MTEDQREIAPLTEEEARSLLDGARAARVHAYAPYSRFPVGAALLDVDGRVHPGANVENASYGLGTCAERSAVVRAMSDGVRRFRAIAVVGPDDGPACMPCGSCRQVLYEIGSGLQVVVAEAGAPRILKLGELLPEAFGPQRLVRTGG